MRRAKGVPSRKEAAASQQYLTTSEESALADWCMHLASTGRPLSYNGARGLAGLIAGRDPPNQGWYKGFLRRHPEMKACKSTGLDPKRAKNFNKTVVNDYFGKRQWFNTKYGGIPPEQEWNMDEKGYQFGGGRTNNQTRYLFSVKTKDQYRI